MIKASQAIGTRLSRRHILLIIVGIGLLCILGPFAYEIYPRHIVLELPLPLDDYGQSEWLFPTYASQRNYWGRYDVWRAETTLVYKGVPENESRKSILDYFENQLSNYGWARSEDMHASCSDILPEARFLPYLEDITENGFVDYLRKDYKPPYGSWENESICLAIWSESPGVFSIVLLTASPSPLTHFLDFLGS